MRCIKKRFTTEGVLCFTKRLSLLSTRKHMSMRLYFLVISILIFVTNLKTQNLTYNTYTRKKSIAKLFFCKFNCRYRVIRTNCLPIIYTQLFYLNCLYINITSFTCKLSYRVWISLIEVYLLLSFIIVYFGYIFLMPFYSELYITF